MGCAVCPSGGDNSGTEHGLVAIKGEDGLFYANAVGAFGAVAAGRNWDRLSSAARMWALKLVDNKEFPILLFPDDALLLEARDISDGSFINNISLIDSRIPFHRGGIMGEE